MNEMIVYQRGQNGPLNHRIAGQMLPPGAIPLYMRGTDAEGRPSETYMTCGPTWPYWDQIPGTEDWGGMERGVTLGGYISALDAECELHGSADVAPDGTCRLCMDDAQQADRPDWFPAAA